MRIPVAIFAILVALCVVVLVLWTLDERPDSLGADHPVHETMRQGGSSERHDGVLPWGFLYGLLSIVLFVAVMALGLRRRGRLPKGSRRALWSGLALYALVFTLLVLSYRGYVEPGADRALFGSFPGPSAWMLYGIWPVPLLFALLYMWNFDRWVISEDEVTEFERLAAESKRDRGRDSAGDDG
ncbi:MAG: hypothetical protein F4112_05565 [Holophagales bacterium]|nr:hypothetical protein [Holophagales bacterium]MYD22964.1 hypothetical protein [Holophagales bacterium]MYI32425.1 hypothetical protein [Holophagales bacterium]